MQGSYLDVWDFAILLQRGTININSKTSEQLMSPDLDDQSPNKCAHTLVTSSITNNSPGTPAIQGYNNVQQLFCLDPSFSNFTQCQECRSAIDVGTDAHDDRDQPVNVC
jgi:hypothetical protein